MFKKYKCYVLLKCLKVLWKYSLEQSFVASLSLQDWADTRLDRVAVQVTDVASLWIWSGQTKLVFHFCAHWWRSVSYIVFLTLKICFPANILTYLFFFVNHRWVAQHDVRYVGPVLSLGLLFVSASLSNKFILILRFINCHWFHIWIASSSELKYKYFCTVI